MVSGVLLTWSVDLVLEGCLRLVLIWLRTVVYSDSAVKQILLTMNDKQSFIIEDLDENHVVIKADEEWRVRLELEAEVRL